MVFKYTSIFVICLLVFGCTLTEEGGACSGKTQVTINGNTKVCVDGKMTSQCTVEGKIYDENAHSKIVCRAGLWMSEKNTEQTTLEKPSPVDCKDDMNCFIEKSQTCNEALVEFKPEFNIL